MVSCIAHCAACRGSFRSRTRRSAGSRKELCVLGPRGAPPKGSPGAHGPPPRGTRPPPQADAIVRATAELESLARLRRSLVLQASLKDPPTRVHSFLQISDSRFPRLFKCPQNLERRACLRGQRSRKRVAERTV